MKRRSILVCLLLAMLCAGCAQTYRPCPDEAELKSSFFSMRGTLLKGTYYCGSDEAWHYFVVDQRIPITDWWDYTTSTGLMAPISVRVPFPTRALSEDREDWLGIDSYDDWFREGRPTYNEWGEEHFKPQEGKCNE